MKPNNSLKIVSYYQLIVGLLILVYWILFIINNSNYSIPFISHLVAELLTSFALLISSYGIFKKKSWSVNSTLISCGMLLYALINILGIYIDTSNTLMSLSISLGIVSVIGILYIVLFSDLKLKNDAV